MIKPFVSSGNAAVCTIISFFGAIILSVFGYGFAHNWEALMGSTHDPEDGAGVARVCYMAAFAYVVLTVLCACQLGVNARQPRGEIRL